MPKKPKRVRARGPTCAEGGSIGAPMDIDVLPLSVVGRNLRTILCRPCPIVVTRSGIAVILMRPINPSEAVSDVARKERP